MKITFITGHLCKERHTLLNELALDLGEYGAEVTVLTGYPSRRISEEIKQYYLDHPIEQISKNVVVRRLGSRKGEGGGLFDRMIKYLLLTKDLYKVAKKTPSDAYFLYSSPPFIGWMGIKLAKIAPTLYNAQDLFPDTLIQIKSYNERNPLIKILRYMEKEVYNNNTRIITISDEMKDTISSKGCDPNKIGVIYNWADTENLQHVEREDNVLMDELAICKGKFIVSYAGDIGLFQGWPLIIEAAKIVNSKNKDIQFVIIGSGSYKPRLIKHICMEKLDFITVHPLQPASRLSEIYSIGDLELVSIEPELTKMALPSKTFVIMATGSAILALVDQNSEIAHLIKNYNLGYTLNHGDAKNLANTILNAYENRSSLKNFGNNAREWCKEYATRKIQTKKYFDEIVSMKKNYSS